MKRLLLASIIIAFSTAAFGFHCPADVKAIDAGLAKANLSDEQKSEIKQLRDQGLGQHESGDHKGAVDTLAKAMRMILTNME